MPLGRPLLRRLRLPFRHECLWCWLEDSNLPPLAYEASALPDELSQLMKIDKRIAAPLPVWKRPCGCAEARRRVQIWTFTMSKSAAPPAP